MSGVTWHVTQIDDMWHINRIIILRTMKRQCSVSLQYVIQLLVHLFLRKAVKQNHEEHEHQSFVISWKAPCEIIWIENRSLRPNSQNRVQLHVWEQGFDSLEWPFLSKTTFVGGNVHVAAQTRKCIVCDNMRKSWKWSDEQKAQQWWKKQRKLDWSSSEFHGQKNLKKSVAELRLRRSNPTIRAAS